MSYLYSALLSLVPGRGFEAFGVVVEGNGMKITRKV